MSILSMAILGIFILAFIITGVVKKVKLKKLDTLLKAKNNDEVIRTCETKFSRCLLTSFVCNIYILRAYWLRNDDVVFQNKLFRIIDETEKEAQKKEYLEIYYHLYIFKNDTSNAKLLLEHILQINDEKFKKASQLAYDVACKQESDFKAIEDDLEAYKGFDLGVVVYNLALSYYQIGDYDIAREYFYSCSACFHTNHYYAKKAKEIYDQLAMSSEEE